MTGYRMRSGVLYCPGCALVVDLDGPDWLWRLLPRRPRPPLALTLPGRSMTRPAVPDDLFDRHDFECGCVIGRIDPATLERQTVLVACSPTCRIVALTHEASADAGRPVETKENHLMTGQPRPEDLAELWQASDQPEPAPPAGRPPVRILLRPDIIDEPGWLEIRSTVALWVAAGDARLEQGSGTPVPAAELANIDDVRDLYGLRLVLTDPTLAATAAATLNVVLHRPDVDHTLNPALRDV